VGSAAATDAAAEAAEAAVGVAAPPPAGDTCAAGRPGAAAATTEDPGVRPACGLANTNISPYTPAADPARARASTPSRRIRRPGDTRRETPARRASQAPLVRSAHAFHLLPHAAHALRGQDGRT